MYQYPNAATYQKNTAYQTGCSANDRENLITSHLSKVKYIADRMAAKLPPSVEWDDLYGAGVIGLIDAVERFDASRGIAFTTFAEMRVRGAILDNLRSLDWASRNTRKRSREIQAAYNHVEQEKGDCATEEEIAAYMKISLGELREILQDLRCLSVLDLDERDEETGLSAIDTVKDSATNAFEQLAEKQTRKNLAKAVDKLPERERRVVALYYLEELNMKEIGEILGVSESRVSQLRTQAIVRLRANI